MQNTWRRQYYTGRVHGRKLIAALFFPFPGSIRNQQRRFKPVLKARENPEASGSSSWDLTFTSSFCFLWHIFVVPSQVFPKILIEESRPSKRHRCILRPAPFQTEISPCLPKCNPDPECKFSPPPSTPHLAVATSGRCQRTLPQVDFNQVLLNEFSLWQRSGCKTAARNAGPHKIFFKKKQWTWFL